LARRGAVLPNFAPILAALSATYLLGDNLVGNELDTLCLALHHLDPGFIAGDFRLSMPPGPRLPFQLALAPLLLVLPLWAASIVGRLGLYALLAGALGRLARKLDMDLPEVLIAGTLYALLGQQIAAGEFVVGGVESKSLAYACVLWGLDGALDEAWKRAGICFGLAVTIHPLVGMWSAIAAAAAVLPEQRAALRGSLPPFLLAAAPGVALAWPALRATAEPSAFGLWIYVYFRHPHHLDPSWFLQGPGPLLRFAAALALGLASLAVRFPTPAQRTMARFARATLAFFVLGLGLSRLPHAERFLVAYPFRVGDTLFPLIGLALLVRWAFRTRTSAPSRAARVAGVAGAAALSLAALRRDVVERWEWDRKPVRTAYAWVREHTPHDALVLCSPALDYAGLYMRRPTVASARAVPTAPDEVAEWYLRLVDLNGGAAPRARGFPAFPELEAGFQALSPEAIDALAAKYGARYLLRRSGRPLPYEALYDDGSWAVFRLR
jgi:hypothetical protein